jgi:hypothetical protein
MPPNDGSVNTNTLLFVGTIISVPFDTRCGTDGTNNADDGGRTMDQGESRERILPPPPCTTLSRSTVKVVPMGKAVEGAKTLLLSKRVLVADMGIDTEVWKW